MNKLNDVNLNFVTGHVAIVLACQRPGPDPIARAHGLKARALVPALGAPLVDRVIAALQQSEWIGRIILVEDRSLEPLSTAPVVARAVQAGDVSLAPAAATTADSVAQVLASLPPRTKCLVTTADNALLTPGILSEFLTETQDADVAIGVAAKRKIEQRYHGASPVYFAFADETVAGAKLIAFHGANSAMAVETWRRIERRRGRALRLLAGFGLGPWIAYALRLVTLKDAFARLSKRLELSIRPVTLTQPEAAIDVASMADLALVDGILARRSCYEKLTLPIETEAAAQAQSAAKESHPKASWREVLDAMCEA